MGQSATTPSTFNPVPHLIGIGVLGAANPLIYYSSEPIVTWLLPLASLALLVGLIYGGYRLLAPARAKAAGLKPFFMLAWVLVALSIFNAWKEKTPATVAPSQVAASSAASNSGLTPFNGKLDPNGFDAANAVLVSPPPATNGFDPSTARPIEWPPAASGQFDPSTAKPVQN